ncbi:hypothetical protein GCM10009821_26520 [Aeromicrobium halocynthiae]|uniref:Uncharacterized protein n=1 Tax=Aeromicrobium halocynthiae TaxID=560557 RepID=A0ABN2W531_9ACTN
MKPGFGASGCFPSHQLDAGTIDLTWATCWPQPAQVVLPQVLQVVGRHMVVLRGQAGCSPASWASANSQNAS